jgi:UDP-N-acetylbacillosamine N-acetyltransferase
VHDGDKRLVIWGASGHALVVADIIRLVKQFNIVGFIDDTGAERHNTEFGGAHILGGREQLDELARTGVTNLICAIGDCRSRLELAAMAEAKGFSLAQAIHPRSVVASDVRVGRGTVIAAGAVVNSGSSIGENVIINTSAGVDHECDIAEGAHIGPGANLGGRVSIGRGTWIGIGAVIRDRVNVGSRAVVGAGAVVVADLPDDVLAYGVPARVIRKIQTHG